MKQYLPNGSIYFKGEFFCGQKNGKGIEYDFAGNIQYEGEYLNGNRHGKGKEYYDSKLISEGEYLHEER